MKKISVAFGPHGNATLAWAVELAGLVQAPLEVVNVFEPTYAEVSPDWFDELVRARREELERVVGDLGADDVDVVVLTGREPLREFAHHLDESSGGLGVVGAHGSHGPGGLGFGRPGHALLHHTSHPIAIVHPVYEPLAGGVIVVGVDGSAPNEAAFRWAHELGARTKARIHAVFVDDSSDTPSVDAVRSRVDALVQAGADLVPVEVHVESGHPTAVLMEHAERDRAAMLVVGTRGDGGFDGLVLGRVPAQLVAHCTVPLVVVPH